MLVESCIITLAFIKEKLHTYVFILYRKELEMWQYYATVR